MENDIDKIDEYLKFLPIEHRELLKAYYEALAYFNSKISLVSKPTMPFAAKQHFTDCVMGIQIAEKHSPFESTVYDFGSGNGFPGLVLGIIRPQVPVVLVERDVRKAEFLKHVAAELKLTNVSVFAEDLNKLDKKSVTQGVTRALGSLSTLLIQMNSLFDKGSVLFHFKAESWSTEIARCPTQIFANWDIQPVGQYTLPDTAVERCIVASRRI